MTTRTFVLVECDPATPDTLTAFGHIWQNRPFSLPGCPVDVRYWHCLECDVESAFCLARPSATP